MDSNSINYCLRLHEQKVDGTKRHFQDLPPTSKFPNNCPLQKTSPTSNMIVVGNSTPQRSVSSLGMMGAKDCIAFNTVTAAAAAANAATVAAKEVANIAMVHASTPAAALKAATAAAQAAAIKAENIAACVLLKATTKAKGGCPKGTTHKNLLKRKDTEKQCVDEVTKYYKQLCIGAKSGRQRKGSLLNIITQTKEDYGLTSFDISKQTIHSHIKRNLLSAPHYGIKSPLYKIKSVIVEMIIAMGNMRQPLTSMEGLQLVKSFIKESAYEKKVIEFKVKRGWSNDRTNPGEVGMSYWRNFLQ